jgi:iron complex outermembrane receptor protein
MRAYLGRAAWLGTVAAAALVATPAASQEGATTDPAAPSNAQTQDEAAQASDAEIVVTARRRNELLLDVPIAVTAYSGEQLNRQGALDITDIADTTPNVTLEVSRGTNSTLTPFIRGIGQQDPVAGFEQGVGLYLDDVYFNRPQAAVLNIYDVERIEVLRGPQGTLYGRNTIGGAIKYVTRRIPTDGPHASLRANVGTYRQLDLIGSASAPLTQNFLVGAAIARLSHRGFGKNLTTGERNYNKDVLAARGTIEIIPSESSFIRLAADKTWDDSNARGGHRVIPNLCTSTVVPLGCAGDFPVLDNVYDSRGGLADPEQKVRAWGVSLWGEVELTDLFKVRNITAYRKDVNHTPIDFDALPFPDVDVPAIYRNRQFSQEVQLVADSGPLQGLLGVYYLNARAQNIFDVRLYTTCPAVPLAGCVVALPGFTQGTTGDVRTKTWAIFGDLTYDFSPQWSASVGGRFTNDKRNAVITKKNFLGGGQPGLGGSSGFDEGTAVGTLSNFDGSRTDKAFTPRASVNFKPTPNHNLYLSFSRGFKGGGFDPRANTTNAPGDTPTTPPTEEQIFEFMAFDPEKVDSYEFGWKASLLNRRLQLATAIFHANYTDVQVPGSQPCTTVVSGAATTGFCGVTTNAGKARIRGLEVEANARVAQDMAIAGDRLGLSGSLGLLDGKYQEFITNVALIGPTDVADIRKIQNTPKLTLSGSIDYDVPVAGGRLNANTTLSYRSKSRQFEFAIPQLDQPGFALWDANLVWRSIGNRYEIGLHGKNLTDKQYITGGYNFVASDALTLSPVINPTTGLPTPSLGRTGTLTAFYGNPRQIWLSGAINF